MEQASSSAAVYLRQGVRAIDETLGEGFAAKKPALVAAFMQAVATDMAAALPSAP
jgi:hypothetical protein